MTNVVAAAAGSGQSLALRSDGTVIGWGGNSVGEATGVPTTTPPYLSTGHVQIGGTTLNNVVSIVASRGFSLALKKDGTVVTWGRNYVPKGMSDITAIAAGWNDSWALKRDGTIVGWVGDPSWPRYGKLNEVEGLSNIVAIAVGPCGNGTRGVALKRDGTVATWGIETDQKGFTVPPEGLTNVVAVAAGASHSLALISDGTVVGWGWNKDGEATGVPTTNSPGNLNFISYGPVRIDGQRLSNVVSIVAGTGYSLALKRDGTVVSWGRMVGGLYPVNIPEGLSNVVAIAAGAEDFCLAITTNRAVAEGFRH